MSTPMHGDSADLGHDLVVELNPYQALLDVVEYVNRSEQPLNQFRALMSFMLETVKLSSDDMNDAVCDAFNEHEARLQAKASR